MNKKTKNILFGVLVFLLGLFFGCIMVWMKTFAIEGSSFLPVLSVIKKISTDLSIVVFTGTLIAFFAAKPKAAGFRVLLFSLGLLMGYYLSTGVEVEMLPMYYLIRWSVYAVLAALAGYLVWHGKKGGWPAAFCAALPIGFLLSRGYEIYKGFEVNCIVALVLAGSLYILMPKKKGQRLKVLPAALLIAVVITQFDAIKNLMGW